MSEPQETPNGIAGASEAASVVELPKAKRKPGRPKGSTKWPGSGRQKGTINRTTAELRRYIHRNANPVGQVCKIAKGKLTLDGLSQADAIRLLYKAVIPELKADILSGPDDGPIRTEDVTRLNMVELGRRAAFLLDLAGRESQIEGAPRSTPTTPFSAPCGPGSASGHAPAPPGQSPAPPGQSPENLKSEIPNQSPHKNYGNPDEARSPNSASRGATAPAADESRLSTSAAAPAPDTIEAEEAPQAAPEAPAEPNVGETAVIGTYHIERRAPLRDGQPPQYAIRRAQDSVPSLFFTGWPAVTRWIMANVPEGTNLTPRIEKSESVFEPVRPEQRAPGYSPGPKIVGSYQHRKRN